MLTYRNSLVSTSWFNNFTDLNAELVGGEHVAIERCLNDNHLRACLYAGLKMHGANRESSPSQVGLGTNVF